ncbi:hypothetical protein FA15DRAFT_664117 [Coprinopsis marcescibilis]|uniref:CHAT domain-containing protein n=1 Tax=Coprinopsis marcescibilis TaxID=230819 RepID=A0A5C3L9X6_COPMA|nr:hypothetical protein FA15DRAFT_664117 [Coprinopsis marcescibilis]
MNDEKHSEASLDFSASADQVRLNDHGDNVGAVDHHDRILKALVQGMDHGVLEAAISRLQQVIARNNDLKTRVAAKCHLVKALLTRFALHGWVEDLDQCKELLFGDEVETEAALGFECFQRMHSGEREWDAQILGPAQQIEEYEYRGTINAETLNVMMNLGEPATHHSLDVRLNIVHGRRLVLKYTSMQRLGTLAELENASTFFQNARSSTQPKDISYFVASTLLRYVGWVKFTECLQFDGLEELNRYNREAWEQDQDGQESYRMGTGMINESKLDDAMIFLSRSMEHRPADHPRRSQTLNNLAAVFLARFYRDRNSQDLDECIRLNREALGLRPAPHPHRLVSLENLASALYARFRGASDIRDLEECITLRRELIKSPPGFESGPREITSDLAMSLFARFEVEGNLEDLEECIGLRRENVSSIPAEHPERPWLLSQISAAFHTRFERTLKLEDLQESISWQREALASAPISHPKRFSFLHTLASFVMRQFNLRNDSKDLEECISIHREALELRPAPHPERSACLTCLGICLSMRCALVGRPEDLDESVSLHRQVVDSTPPDSLTFEFISNLAVTLFDRFRRKGDIQDLDECISTERKIVALFPGRPEVLEDLAISLSARFERNGDNQDLDECISLRRESVALVPDTHPKRFRLLLDLANLHRLRSQLKQNPQDLDDSIGLARDAVALRPLPNFERFKSLCILTSSLHALFRSKSDPKDLDESISIQTEALSIEDIPGPPRTAAFFNRGEYLFERYTLGSILEDLQESVVSYRAALQLTTSPHSDRHLAIQGLATSLHALFKHNYDRQSLEECIELRREALSMMEGRSSDRHVLLKDLAPALLARFKLDSSVQDLEEIVSLWKEMLSLVPETHPLYLPFLNNLSASLSMRFDSKGDFNDLEECIASLRQVLELRSMEDPDRYQSLGNLAKALSTRFEHKHSFDDLEECIALEREVIQMTPVSHMHHQTAQNNFAASLFERFLIKRDHQDLDGSILHARQALSSIDENHPSRIPAINNLGNFLSSRFECTGNLEDLNQGISLQQDALKYVTEGYPNRPGMLGNLAISLQKRFKHSGDVMDLEKSIDLFRDALKRETGSLMLRLRTAKWWATYARKAGHCSALEAYQHAISLLPLLVAIELTLEQRKNVLGHTKNLSGEAVQCAIESNELETAVVFLSTARSTFWSQALQLRDPLEELNATNPLLANKFRDVSNVLENSTQGSEMVSKTPVPDALHLYTLSRKRVELLAEIRQIDGFQDFLLPPTFDSLKAAARNGPIVFLNPSVFGCDAIIMKLGGELERVPLPTMNHKLLQELKVAIQDLTQNKLLRAGTVEVLENLLQARGEGSRKPTRKDPTNLVTSNDHYQQVLEMMWIYMVKPIIDALKLEKTDTPGRLWWCPAGDFVFLPIHAAGIYSNQSSLDECLSDFAIPSYCYSPQNVLFDSPAVPGDFKMLAVLEPEGTEVTGKGLPMTEVELEKIQEQIPSANNLIVRLGSREFPNTTETILNDIQQASFVHFGCHGVQHESNPLESSLLLSGGRLTMSRIIRGCQQSSGACLAYLSACETAMGDDERPDESLNLAATMMFAGFRAVVGTMWSIQDEDAPIVADVFYQHLFRKCPPDPADVAEALHLAVKELRRLKMPFQRWVPFVHFGI